MIIKPLYDIHICDQRGTRKRQLNAFEELTITLRLNGPNILHLVHPTVSDNERFPYDLLLEDAWFEVWRGIETFSSKKMIGESPFLLQEEERFFDVDIEMFKVDALSAPVIATWPIVAYDAGSSEADKADYADDMIKEIAAENLGSSATVTTRDMSAYLQIQADRSLGVSLSKAFSRRELATIFNELCASSAANGTRLYWDIVLPTPGNLNNRVLELRTFTRQRGAYRGFDNDNPLVFSEKNKNLTNVRLKTSYQDVTNYAYTSGYGQEAANVVGEASDTTRIAKSPWGRVKESVKSANTDSQTVADNEAEALLRERRPVKILTGDIVQTEDSLFGVHYDTGDMVGVEAFGQRWDAIIAPVTIDYRNGKETIRTSIRIEE